MSFHLLARAIFRAVGGTSPRLSTAGHLHNLDGSLYMGRWWLVKPGTWQSRVLSALSRGRYESIRIHHINSGDAARDMHSHPFTYSTLILDGFYVEELLDGMPLPVGQRKVGTHIRAVGDLVHIGGDFHRIRDVSIGGVWTMFCMGPNRETWGFLLGDGTFVDRRTYFRMKGYRRNHLG